MTYLLTIDPGMSTGITLGEFWENTPYERLAFWQIKGGLDALEGWIHDHYDNYPDRWYFPECADPALSFRSLDYELVVEKFVPLPAPRTFKTDELEPIRIEGAVQVMVRRPVWQRAASMVLAGGTTPAQRKRASDDVLRRLGLWTTGSMVGMKDANDVNSAQKHAIAYLRSIKHRPTIEALLEE